MLGLRKGFLVLGVSVASVLAYACASKPAATADSTSNLDVGSELVISQVWGGGGTSHAAYQNDFVELFNRSSAPVSLSGKSLQYASAGTRFSKKSAIKLPDQKLEPGQYFLVQFAGNSANGEALTPDFTPEKAPSLSAESGKVALVSAASEDELLDGCGKTGEACPTEHVLDFVGYGDDAQQAEGAPTKKTKTEMAAARKEGGCADSNDNSADFELQAPAPRAMAAKPSVCKTRMPEEAGVTNVDEASTQEPIEAGPQEPIEAGPQEPIEAGPEEPVEAGTEEAGTHGENPDPEGEPEAGTPKKKDAGTSKPKTTDPDPDTEEPTTEPSKKTTLNPSAPKPETPAPAESDCSMTPGGTQSPTGFAGIGLAFALAAFAKRRRR